MTLFLATNSTTGVTVYHVESIDRSKGFRLNVGNVMTTLTEEQANELADYLNKDRVGE